MKTNLVVQRELILLVNFRIEREIDRLMQELIVSIRVRKELWCRLLIRDKDVVLVRV